MSAEPLTPEAREVFDSAACGLLLTEADGRILRANRTFCTWVGHDEEALAGRRFQDLLTMGGRIFHQTHWAPLLEMQGSISEVKLELKHRDGTTIPMVTNAIRRQSGDRMLDQLAVFVARDRDTYEKELVRSEKRLRTLVQEANELQRAARDRALFAEQMMGIVSHDLRNPLSTIKMGAEVLAEADPSPIQERVLGQIHRAALRANRLIGDLLDFTQARLGTGLSVTRLPVDLHAVIAESVEELALAFPGRELVHRAEGETECVADRDRLQQLVGNLVGNAMTYGDEEGPVTVRSSVLADAFTVAVHNHGAPIPVERQAGLFSPMTRGTATGSQRSVGLGLFIVREITRAHDGTVVVESTETAGTTFTARFPRVSPSPSSPR